MVSPDGRRFVARAAYDCGGPSAFVGSTSRPDAHELGTVIGAAEKLDAGPLGWTSKGDAIFEAEGSCGPPLQGPGIYALDGTRARAIYLPPDPDADWPTAEMWAPALVL
jgi:hypothetical protein